MRTVLTAQRHLARHVMLLTKFPLRAYGHDGSGLLPRNSPVRTASSLCWSCCAKLPCGRAPLENEKKAAKNWHCLPSNSCIRHIVTAQSVMGHDRDVERVSRAYLGNARSKGVQKHDGNRLIYEVRGQTVLRFVSLSFYATTAFGLYVAPDFIATAWECEAVNKEILTNLLAVTMAVVGLPTCLRMLSKRLVLKLYHNEARETYLAVTQSMLLTNKLTKFSLQDVKVVEKKGILQHLFNLTSFKANKWPFFVNPYNFKLPSDFNHLHGFER